jgi:hypothetical protein
VSTGRTVAVPSESRHGVTHYVSVENGRPVSCTCEGFTYRGSCKHVGDLPSTYAERVATYGYPPRSVASEVRRTGGWRLLLWRHPIIGSRIASFYGWLRFQQAADATVNSGRKVRDWIARVSEHR